MSRLFSIGFWARALRNPIVLAGLAVDLAPIYAVLAWGWGAAPLVLVYWAENVLIGVMTLPRIFISAAASGLKAAAFGVFLCAFFTVHYGLFCAVHGSFLTGFLMASDALHGDAAGLERAGDFMMNIPAMFRIVIASGLHVDWMLTVIVAWQLVVFLWEFIGRGGWRRTNPMVEMFAPYGRIVVLHFGIFAGAFALIVLGQPMAGVLALILLRAVWGVFANDRLSNPLPIEPDAAVTKSYNDLLEKLGSPEKPPVS